MTRYIYTLNKDYTIDWNLLKTIGEDEEYTRAENEIDSKDFPMPENFHVAKWNPKKAAWYDADPLVVDIKQVQEAQISLLEQDKEIRIAKGFDSDCQGTMKHYDCTDKDINMINGLVNKANSILVNEMLPEGSKLPIDNILEWKASNEPVCYPWKPLEIIKLGTDFYKHVSKYRILFETVSQYVRTLTGADLIKSITLDSPIPKEGDTNANSTPLN
jgi:hypothetical protein